MRLDGTMVGKFGRAGKLLKEFGTVNAIDCRTENTLYVGEVGNFPGAEADVAMTARVSPDPGCDEDAIPMSSMRSVACLKGRIAEVNLTSGRSSVQRAHLYPPR